MSNSLHHALQTKTRGVVVLPIRVSILGNTTPANGTFTVLKGNEFVKSIARTGVGTYRVTLREKYYDVLGYFTSILPHGGGARDVRKDAVTINPASGTDATADFVVMNASLVAADTANAETDVVDLLLLVKNTTVAR